MTEDGKSRGVAPQQPPPYGTFQGVATHSPPTAMGFPQPVPPPGASEPSAIPPPHPPYYAHAYQTVPGYAIAGGHAVRERHLPCCGCGFGWFLFIIGFFLGAIPWYVGAVILLCARYDYREKPGYIACAIAACVATVAIIIGATKGADVW